ncbi:SDR family NAD(P)-dependent oxidoreductase [Massilia sp. 9096]|uniref:SDR family NAD(P)-dependent oxidoreductase n=1 Tax=Massilia sp. 9096 TaxID=1500894 RepID=UPI00056582D1|nr:SDR family NAD(P)-dependent oxidoreductase [Massilia sp. 9096]
MKRNTELTWHLAAPGAFKGKKAAIVGGTGGIGRALSRQLAVFGAQVVVVGQTFRDEGLAGVEFVKADLSLMREARRIAPYLQAESLDFLIFTNGIIAAPQREETDEGIERDMAISYLSRLVILDAIAPVLGARRGKAAAKPRVFVMGYPGTNAIGAIDDLNAERAYKAMSVHMNTVAGNEALVLDFARRYPGLGFFGLNPGLVKTNIRDNLFGKGSLKSAVAETLIGLFTPTAETYARRILPLLSSPDIERHSGAMFDRKGHAIMPSEALTRDYIARFMRGSEALIARAGAVPASARDRGG